ncbi:MAG: methylmalonyl Co-A mutase-associated GTPase MeaB, partial [Leptothrix sp. (in: Bacteria)]|nr:methylmalonyl Co-A mutase-associated GTPase MeaB [Leptothrix sp. (in: b-proteobacteria)]
VVINKADLDAAAATRARAQITSALRYLGPHGHNTVPVLQLSALTGSGVAEFWQAVSAQRDARQQSGETARRRRRQEEAWMWERIQAGLQQRFRQHPAVQAALPGVAAEVTAGRLPASVAARRLLDLMD